MGLDMYLYKKTYVKNWEHMKPEEKTDVIIRVGGKPHPFIKSERISEIQEEIGYWRKANAIHDWMVHNVANGVDDCKEVYVSDKKLRELLDICRRVVADSTLKKGKIQNGWSYEGGQKKKIMEDGEFIADPSVAKMLLPTSEGFFFGGTDYDKYYLEDIKDTIKILETCIIEIDRGDRASYYYEASW